MIQWLQEYQVIHHNSISHLIIELTTANSTISLGYYYTSISLSNAVLNSSDTYNTIVHYSILCKVSQKSLYIYNLDSTFHMSFMIAFHIKLCSTYNQLCPRLICSILCTYPFIRFIDSEKGKYYWPLNINSVTVTNISLKENTNTYDILQCKYLLMITREKIPTNLIFSTAKILDYYPDQPHAPHKSQIILTLSINSYFFLKYG